MGEEPWHATAGAGDGAANENQKRKHGDVDDFQRSKYFQIRTAVKDLRPLVIEILQTPDFRNSKAAKDILTRMKYMMGLLEEMRAETSSSKEPKKLQEEPPMTGDNKDEHMGKPQRGETHASQHRAGEISSASVNAAVTVGENISKSKELGKQLAGDCPGTYVVGGSPTGWNFILYPGGEAVYYGRKKVQFMELQGESHISQHLSGH